MKRDAKTQRAKHTQTIHQILWPEHYQRYWLSIKRICHIYPILWNMLVRYSLLWHLAMKYLIIVMDLPLKSSRVSQANWIWPGLKLIFMKYCSLGQRENRPQTVLHWDAAVIALDLRLWNEARSSKGAHKYSCCVLVFLISKPIDLNKWVAARIIMVLS